MGVFPYVVLIDLVKLCSLVKLLHGFIVIHS
jgi:hypothetical protein